MKKIKHVFTMLALFGMTTRANAQITPTMISDSALIKNLIPCGANHDYFKSLGLSPAVSSIGSIGGGGAPASTPPDLFPAYAIEHCGKFDVYYEDLLPTSPAAGFSDISLGAVRRNTLCAVLTYVQSVFDFSTIPAGSPIRFHVEQSYAPTVNPSPAGTQMLAQAGPFFINTGIPQLINGFVYDYTTTGTDPAGVTQYHSEMLVNFDQVFPVGYPPIMINWHNDHTLPIANCQYDLFSVLLHEVGHTLGWLSFIHNDPGTGFPESSLGSNQFSGLDYQLHKGTMLPFALNPLLVGPSTAPAINPMYIGSTTAITDNEIWIGANPAPDNHPVYSGFYVPFWSASFAPGSILSHLDDQMWLYSTRSRISPGDVQDYVMAPFGVKGKLHRQFTDVEINTLIGLAPGGYPINTGYAGTANLSNLPPYSIRMAGYTTVFDNDFAEAVPADFPPLVNNVGAFLDIDLALDGTLMDPEGDPITFVPSSLVNIRGCGNGGNNHSQLTVMGPSKIRFTPRADFYGRAQFGLRLQDPSNEPGSYVIYTIDVLKGTNVSCAAGTNIILNGDLEEGTEVKQLGPEEVIEAAQQENSLLREGKVRQGIQFGDCHPYNFISNNWGPYGAGDIVKESWINCSGTIYRSDAGSSTTTFPISWGWPVVPGAAGGAGERYRMIRSDHNYFNLCSDMQNCKQYILEFDYYAQPGVPAVIPLTVGFTNAATFPALSSLEYSFVHNIAVTSGSWQHITIPFTYCGTMPAGILNLRQNTVWLNFYGDNLQLREVLSPPPPLGVIISPASPAVCAGSSITLSSALTDALCTPAYSWSPGGATTASITVSPASTTVYSLTVNDGCRSTTANTTVTVNTASITASASPSTVVAGGAVTLTTNATGAVWSPGGPGSTITVYPASTTTYTVTGNDPLNGCSGTATVTVTVTPACSIPPGTTVVIPPGPGPSNNSSAYGSSFTSGPIVMNGNFIVDNNFTITGVPDIQMLSGTKIIILPGFTLTIVNSRLYSCGTSMWEGIEIRPGAKLIMHTVNIEDAKIAVWSLNNLSASSPSDFNLQRVFFNRNHIGLKVENHNYASLHPGLIRSCTFTSQASVTSTTNTATLDAPYNTQPAEYGVELMNVNTIIIGDASSSSWKNNFRYLRVGIRAQASTYTVYNNDFRNHVLTPACAIPISPPPGFSCPVIGWAVWNTKVRCTVGGYAPNQPNNFQDLSNGILHEQASLLNVFKNTFVNITSTTLGVNSVAIYTRNWNDQGNININDNDFLTLETGLLHWNNAYTFYGVKNNSFRSFPREAISAVQSSYGSITIEQNTFNQSTGSVYNGNIAVKIGNAGSPLSVSPTVNVSSNLIYRANKGVYLTNINRPNVSYNTIGFKSAIAPLTPDFYYGIRAMNGNTEYIYQNYVYKGSPQPTSAYENSVYGISIETNATQTAVIENSISLLGTGMRFRNYPNKNSTIRCNIMNQNWSGLTLDAVDVGQQGQPASISYPNGVAHDNVWNDPSSTLPGSISGRGLAGWVTPAFYTRSAGYPYCPDPVNLSPANTIHTACSTPTPLTGGLISGAPTNCSNICYTPPCSYSILADIARNAAPFDSIVDPVRRLIMHQGLLRSVLADSIPPDTTTIDGYDIQQFVDTSLVNNNAGRLVDVMKTFFAGDTLLAAAKNSAVLATNCAEEYQQTVNEIFLRTWALGIFELSAADSATLVNIAIQDPLNCGPGIYDARVMTDIDVNDFSAPDHAMHPHLISEQEEGMVEDKIGVLYPNPAKNACVYEAQLRDTETGMIVMSDLQGKVVSSYKLTSGYNKLEIDLSTFSNGVYLYKIMINGAVADHKKLVIAK